MKPSVFDRIAYRFRVIPRSVGALDSLLLLFGTLRRVGWAASNEAGKAVNGKGDPIPWFTYPAVFWLASVMKGDEHVFEYGAGQSTLWFSARAASVSAVEHDTKWAAMVAQRSPTNVTVLERDVSGREKARAYVRAISEFNRMFDIVVVDGRLRTECIAIGMNYVASDGLLVLDNSDRTAYADSLVLLAREGFYRIDFVGPMPGSTNFGSTSVFCRSFARWIQSPAKPTAWGRNLNEFGPMAF